MNIDLENIKLSLKEISMKKTLKVVSLLRTALTSSQLVTVKNLLSNADNINSSDVALELSNLYDTETDTLTSWGKALFEPLSILTNVPEEDLLELEVDAFLEVVTVVINAIKEKKMLSLVFKSIQSKTQELAGT